MWLEYEALEIRIGEQNGRERGLRGVLFWEQNPRRLFANGWAQNQRASPLPS